MTGRLEAWTDARRRYETGRAVAASRAAGISWKVLVALFGRSRVQLWRYMHDFEAIDPPHETKNPDGETSLPLRRGVAG